MIIYSRNLDVTDQAVTASGLGEAVREKGTTLEIMGALWMMHRGSC